MGTVVGKGMKTKNTFREAALNIIEQRERERESINERGNYTSIKRGKHRNGIFRKHK